MASISLYVPIGSPGGSADVQFTVGSLDIAALLGEWIGEIQTQSAQS